jgi:CheY-like chemotaxis protein
MSGDEVLERLRQECPGVRVVMVTANQDEDAARQLLARGAFDYVRKPFEPRRARAGRGRRSGVGAPVRDRAAAPMPPIADALQIAVTTWNSKAFNVSS